VGRDWSLVSLEAKLDRLVALQEAANRIEAEKVEVLAAIAVDRDRRILADCPDEDDTEFDTHCRLEDWSDAPELVAPILGVSLGVATGRLHTAVGLVHRAPALVAEMAAGRLDGYRASMVHADLADAPAAVEEAVVARLVGHARKVGAWVEPVGPLRRRTRTIVARCAPDLPVAGAKADRRDRGIDVRGLSETLDEWTWRVPVEDSRLVRAAVEEHAGVLRSENQDLSVPQSRSDALTALVLDHTNVTVHLHAAVPADDTASDLVRLTGFGATDTTLVPTTWLRDALDTGHAVIDQPLLCDPGTGALIAGDITRGFRPSTRHPTPCTTTRGATTATDVDPRYRIPAAIRRFIAFRDKTCRFPGCSISTTFCDLDHVTPWPHGPTTPNNLIALCRRHHRLKQTPHWNVRLLPDATTEWTTPYGKTITTSPVNLLNTIPPAPNLAALPPDPAVDDPRHEPDQPDLRDLRDLRDLSPMERHLSELLTAA
jgi:hypothetical protein